MNKELHKDIYDDLNPFIKKLIDEKPHFFHENPNRLCHYSYVKSNWQPIFLKLLEDLEKLGEPYPTICQLKDKFDTARFYFDYPEGIDKERRKLISDLVSKAEYDATERGW